MMYVFELVDEWSGNVTCYSSLNQIPVEEGLCVRVYPVTSGDQDTEESELIIYKNGSWEPYRLSTELTDAVLSENYEQVDTDKIIRYKGYMFNSEKAFLNYLLNNGEINKVKINNVSKKNYSSLKKNCKKESYQNKRQKLDAEMDEYHRAAGCCHEKLRLDEEMDEYHRAAGCYH